MAQYTVPTSIGVLSVDENNASDQYMLPGAVVLNDSKVAASQSNFFLVMDVGALLAAILGLTAFMP